MTVALLFPGQGAYTAEAARSLAETFPDVAEVYAEVDAGARAAGAAPVSDLLLAAQPPATAALVKDAPESLQLAIYAVSVAISRLVAGGSEWSGVSLGHSLGEVAALQTGGALSVTAGAQVVALRSRALRAVDGAGGMLALACGADRAGDLIDVVGEPSLAVAAVNAPRQTVVSGPHEALATLTAVAGALRVAATALPSPYAFHNPALRQVSDDFARRIADVPVQPLVRPVYSPILGRYYDSTDDIRALVASHLVAPVDFASAIRQMRAAGVTTFVECASGSTLGALAAKSAERAESVTAAQRGNERSAVAQARELLGGADVAPRPVSRPVSPPVSVPISVPVSVPVLRPAPQAAVKPAGPSRTELFTELRGMYAEALEYPAEVFTEDVALEAELGVDSVKQTELFARTVEKYELPQPSEAIALAQFDTMGKVVDLVWSLMSEAGHTESALTARSAA